MGKNYHHIYTMEKGATMYLPLTSTLTVFKILLPMDLVVKL